MASNTSKTARASVRAGQAAGGALSVLGEFKYLIPLNSGKHAYVRNLTNGKTAHLRTDSDAFVEEIRVLAAAGHGAKIRAELVALAAAHPAPRLGRDREAPRRRRRLRDRLIAVDSSQLRGSRFVDLGAASAVLASRGIRSYVGAEESVVLGIESGWAACRLS